MNRLTKIVQAVLAQSSGVQSRLNLARVGLKAGVNLSRINENTPDNPELEKKILTAAKLVLGYELPVNFEEQADG